MSSREMNSDVLPKMRPICCATWPSHLKMLHSVPAPRTSTPSLTVPFGPTMPSISSKQRKYPGAFAWRRVFQLEDTQSSEVMRKPRLVTVNSGMDDLDSTEMSSGGSVNPFGESAKILQCGPGFLLYLGSY